MPARKAHKPARSRTVDRVNACRRFEGASEWAIMTGGALSGTGEPQGMFG
jgi:hypothetical protein